ncbi:MAG: hypothetical protein AAF346_00080 [Pseudomonadota bacterium]
MADDLLTKEFKPCVSVLDEPKRTEIVLRDVVTVWRPRGGVDLGYDLNTNELVAIRVFGDVSKQPTDQ